MASFIRNSIEYYGIDSLNNRLCKLQDIKNFKQSNINLQLCLPKEKPNIGQILSVKIDKNISKTKLVKTPVGKSMEGQILTGYKLLVMGDIGFEINYVASGCNQSVHSFHGCVPFCEYVVMPEVFNVEETIVPEIYIEDIYINQKDCRCMYGSVTLMVVAELCSFMGGV